MTSVSDSDVSDGPVLTLMSKRLRALKKKYNRILQLEENYIANKKPLNKEQEDLLSSKSAVAILIDEYEKLRQPLAAAVQEEISKLSTSIPATAAAASDEKTPELEDILGLIYFSSLFDVKPQSEFTSTMLTRTHERGCCLTYDYVTDDATDLLGERDLDVISAFGTMLTSRPVYSGVSHREALEGCVRHAALWLRCAEQPIGPSSDFTYAGLREKLKKILASDYFTTTPEMKVPVDVVAAVGKYGVSVPCQVQDKEEAMEPNADITEQHQHHKDDDQEDVQATEVGLSQSSPVDTSPKDEVGELNTSEVATDHQEPEKLDVNSEHNLRETDHKEKQQYNPRRQYQNQRGGSRGNGGGRRGYADGRGSRGGRGSGYQNGRSQQYYESGYFPRNYYNPRGRGGGRYNNNHGAPTQDSHVELGAS